MKYEDSRSCILAVDNFAGMKVRAARLYCPIDLCILSRKVHSMMIQLCGRSLRVDHVEKYRLPKKLQEKEAGRESRELGPGHAYQDQQMCNQYSLEDGQDLFAPTRAILAADCSHPRSAKSERKKERQRRREEKEEKKRQREAKRQRRLERRRSKRARRTPN